ncbi:MAG: translocation/assembly module TamB domain-containing protein [Butyricimonas virosa]|nr:translocation/assembly module TamB domain-containing protein [Butyricimonas virosa]
MRKLFKYTLRIILVLFTLVVLVMILLYIPAIQNFVKGKAEQYVNRNLDMKLSVGRILLKFPLDLAVENIYLGQTEKDTLLYADVIQVNVALTELLKKEIEVRRLVVENAAVHFEDSLSGLKMNLVLEELNLRVDRLNLSRQEAEIPFIALKGGKIRMNLGGGESAVDTVGGGEPMRWRFKIGEITIDSVDYQLQGLPMGEFHAGMGEARLKGIDVGLEKQTVDLEKITLVRGFCDLLMTESTGEQVEAEMSTVESMPWEVRVGTVELEDNRFLMKPMTIPVDAERFPETVRISALSLKVDSVFNRGTEVTAIIQNLRFKEGNGLDLRDLSCRVSLGSEQTNVSNLILKTINSQLKMNVRAEAGISDFGMETPFQLSMEGNVAGQDVLLFMPDSNGLLNDWLSNKIFSLSGLVRGKVDQLNIAHFDIGAAGGFSLKSEGNVAFVTDMERIAGELNLALVVDRGEYFVPLLSENGNAGFVIPDHLSLETGVHIADQAVKVDVELNPGEGVLRAVAGYGWKENTYQAEVHLKDFALDKFMPNDSLGAITANLLASGRGLDWKEAMAMAKVDFELASLYYNGYDYKNVILDAALKDQELTGELWSGNQELDLGMKFRLRADENAYKISLNGDLENVDLKGLHFTPENMAFSLGLDVNAELKSDSTSSLQAVFSNIVLQDFATRKLGNLEVTFSGLQNKTLLDVKAGDLTMKFEGDGGGYTLIDRFRVASGLLVEQIEKHDFNMEKLNELLPDFRLTIDAQQENLLNSYLKSSGIRFERMNVDLGTDVSRDFGVSSKVYGLNIEGIVLDSVLIYARQKDVALRYGVDVFGAKDQLEGLAQLTVEGNVEYDQINVRIREHANENGEIFNIGANVALQDSSFSVSISPDPLILGYVSWQINRGNFIRLKQGEIPAANLQMLNGDKRIRLISEEDADHKLASLIVDIKGVDLGGLSKALSFIPDISGLLGVDVQMYSKNDVIDVSGAVNVDDFYYGKEHVGNLGLGIKYRLSRQTEHDVDFSLSVDGVKALLTKGKLMTGSEDKDIALDIDIPKFPLRVAGAFTPPGIMKLDGDMIGAFQVKGQMNQPLINGDLRFKDGTIEALMIGTTFKIDSSAIVIHDNLLDFNHFGLIAPNKQRLELLGTVDFASFSAIKMDASVQAKNFQAMKVKENTETMVYGKVFVDLSATLKGMLDNLKVRGNINLLDNSEVYYTLKSSPLELTDRSADVVRFVSFSDTTQLAAADELQQVSSVNLDLLMSVNIAPLVGLNVLLSSNGQNRVAINGGGNLTYTLNPVGETRLVGRYVLTSGIVSYGLPVIGQKDFKIQDGSFVEWTGDLANPTLNITAAETISASVTDDSQKSRLVTFNAMIKISNTLEKLDITFDLAAEGDITIQNQLAAMTAEERSKEAMNMMIYGTYSGPGTVAKSNASDNALNNFVENELNQWSRKHLKNMDLTFGINTYNQVSEAGESKKTDYSYQFSKRLFNNKVRVKVGGRISTDNDPAAGGVEENLVDDIAIEYVFGKNPNFFLKIFRHTGYESVLEGEVTQTGIGVVLRKNFQKFMDIFRRKKKVQVESKIEPIENEKSGK